MALTYYCLNGKYCDKIKYSELVSKLDKYFNLFRFIVENYSARDKKLPNRIIQKAGSLDLKLNKHGKFH